jgi:hypothetical protein
MGPRGRSGEETEGAASAARELSVAVNVSARRLLDLQFPTSRIALYLNRSGR